MRLFFCIHSKAIKSQNKVKLKKGDVFMDTLYKLVRIIRQGTDLGGVGEGRGGGGSILISFPCQKFAQIPASSPDFASDNIPCVQI